MTLFQVCGIKAQFENIVESESFNDGKSYDNIITLFQNFIYFCDLDIIFLWENICSIRKTYL